MSLNFQQKHIHLFFSEEKHIHISVFLVNTIDCILHLSHQTKQPIEQFKKKKKFFFFLMKWTIYNQPVHLQTQWLKKKKEYFFSYVGHHLQLNLNLKTVHVASTQLIEAPNNAKSKVGQVGMANCKTKTNLHKRGQKHVAL